MDEFGLEHRAVRNGLRLLESWPARRPLIVGRERTATWGKPDALILRDRPPDGDWVRAGHRLLESPVPFWVKRSIWLIKCYHRNDRFYWISSRFLEEMHKPGMIRTAPVAAAAPPRHRAFLAAAPDAGALRDARF